MEGKRGAANFLTGILFFISEDIPESQFIKGLSSLETFPLSLHLSCVSKSMPESVAE